MDLMGFNGIEWELTITFMGFRWDLSPTIAGWIPMTCGALTLGMTQPLDSGGDVSQQSQRSFEDFFDGGNVRPFSWKTTQKAWFSRGFMGIYWSTTQKPWFSREFSNISGTM